VSTTDNVGPDEEHTRRDFLYIATGAISAVGIAGVAWPFIDQMNPDASTQALATVDVDVSSLGVGEAMTVMWQGKPVFIRHRTGEEVEAARQVSLDELPDPVAHNPNLPDGGEAPATDENRAAQREGMEQWLVMIGICTHLGCVPLGEQGDYGGWFCPCHGSHYDTAGRIRIGPAPRNLDIPPYAFETDTSIVVG